MNRKSTPGAIYLLADANVLTNTVTRLRNCHSLLSWYARQMLFDEGPTPYASGLIGVGDLLGAIIRDFQSEIAACLDAEEDTRKRNRQRTSPERKQKHEQS